MKSMDFVHAAVTLLVMVYAEKCGSGKHENTFREDSTRRVSSITKHYPHTMYQFMHWSNTNHHKQTRLIDALSLVARDNGYATPRSATLPLPSLLSLSPSLSHSMQN